MHPPAGGASCHPQHFLFWPAAPEPETREGTRAHCSAAPGPLATYSLAGNVPSGPELDTGSILGEGQHTQVTLPYLVSPPLYSR